MLIVYWVSILNKLMLIVYWVHVHPQQTLYLNIKPRFHKVCQKLQQKMTAVAYGCSGWHWVNLHDGVYGFKHMG